MQRLRRGAELRVQQAPQLLVDEQPFRRVPLGGEAAHQHAAAALVVGRERREGLAGSCCGAPRSRQSVRRSKGAASAAPVRVLASMHLSAIRLRGFKSFVDPVEVRLEPCVAVVVGPNGSGKSNVADGIVWAAG